VDVGVDQRLWLSLHGGKEYPPYLDLCSVFDTREGADVIVRDELFIDGKWVASTGTATIDVVNPATEETCGRVPEGTPEDVNRAVAAARAAFYPWSALSVAERCEHLTRLRDGLAARAEEIAVTIATEMGAPIGMARAVQLGLPLAVLGSYLSLLPTYEFESEVGNSLILREPVGVVGAITPWNYPLHQLMCKVAPALGAGCTVVAKPSEVAPLSAFMFAEVVEAAGLPAGVFNLVSGTGPAVGEPMAAHPDIDMISLTGSVRAGRRVSELAAASIKRVTLELGGKSACVLLPDVEGDVLDKAIESALYNAYYNTGQTCSAWTRLLVSADRHDEIAERVGAAAQAYAVGDPFDEEVRLGPLASDMQLRRVRGYIEAAVADGARLVCGGAESPPGLDRGYYVAPTVFAGVDPQSAIAQEEVFGPVLSVLSYQDEDDAIEIANGTNYGLAGGVWSADADRAKAFARRLRTGQVTVNGGKYNVLAPFGGYKQSGHGRELGEFGLEEYLEVKSLQC
jgi:betaine-aldehyde dehydrogenase